MRFRDRSLVRQPTDKLWIIMDYNLGPSTNTFPSQVVDFNVIYLLFSLDSEREPAQGSILDEIETGLSFIQ